MNRKVFLGSLLSVLTLVMFFVISGVFAAPSRAAAGNEACACEVCCADGTCCCESGQCSCEVCECTCCASGSNSEFAAK